MADSSQAPIIANPSAGHGRAGPLIERVRKLWGRAVDLRLTQGPGDATRLARQLAEQGCPRIVAMGGDGTIREVAEGVLGSDTELGLIPIGTGNDLARSLGLPLNRPARALRVLDEGVVLPVDAGWDGRSCFLSVLGVGYPALVAEEANRTQWLRGPPAFFVSFYRALQRLEVVPVRLRLDDRELEVGCTSILIHNTPYTGGGLKIAPMAELTDGYFDVVVIDSVGRLDLMWNFPRVYRGTHLGHPNFHHYRCRRVQVSSPRAMTEMRDGDLAGELPVDVRVWPGALKVVVAPVPGA